MPPMAAPAGLAGRPPLSALDRSRMTGQLSVSEMAPDHHATANPAMDALVRQAGGNAARLPTSGIFANYQNEQNKGFGSVADATNAGYTAMPWAASSGAGPGSRGYQGSFGGEEEGEDGQYAPTKGPAQPFHTKRPDSEIHGALNTTDYYQRQNMRPTTSQLVPRTYAHGTSTPVPPGMPLIAGDAQEDGKPNEELILPTPQGTHVIPLKDIPKMSTGTRHRHNDRDTRARPSTAAIGGGLHQFNNDQRNLSMERGARMGRDPLTGLSQAPTEREVTQYLAGFEGRPEEHELMRRYFIAKESGHPEFLAMARDAVKQHAAQLNALRGQEQRAKYDQPYSQTDENPMPEPGSAAALGRTASLTPPAPATPELAPPTLIPGLMGKTAAPSAAPQTKTSQYGTGSASFAPRTTFPAFNLGKTYDPNFQARVTAENQPTMVEGTMADAGTENLTPPSPMEEIQAPHFNYTPPGYTSPTDYAMKYAQRGAAFDKDAATLKHRLYKPETVDVEDAPLVSGIKAMNPVPDIKKAVGKTASFGSNVFNTIAGEGTRVLDDVFSPRVRTRNQ